MEAVRERKPKPKERTRVPDPPMFDPPPLPERTGVLDRVLPDVPHTEPGEAPPLPPRRRTHSPTPMEETTRERSPSPEPEVIDIPPDLSITESEAAPPPRYIFPRVNGDAAATSREQSSPATSQHSESSQAQEEQPTTQPVAPAYPLLDLLPEPTLRMPDIRSPAAIGTGVTMPLPPSYAELSQAAQEKDREAMRQSSTTWQPTVPREDAPPMYPLISVGVLETTEQGLLSEHTLLSFYHNELYEASDDIVDRFCKEEENPKGPLFTLLQRLKKVCEDIAMSTVEEGENASALSKCLFEVWLKQQRSQQFNEACGENRPGTGTARYDVAILSQEKLEEMKRLLSVNRQVTLRARMSQEVEARALALQIQWLVIGINHAFLGENRATVSDPPMLMDDMRHIGMPAARSRLKAALSDLFGHLRQPNLPRRFVDAATGWVTELACVLHKACLVTDGVWLLLHVLRLPSPCANWAAPLIQTFVQSPVSGKLKMDYALAMLNHLMSPIKSREHFLHAVGAVHEEVDDSWMILDDDGERELNPVTISETDLTALLEQLPISDFYSLAFLHFSTTTSDRTSQMVSLVAFQLLLMKVLHDGLETYSALGYKQFCKQIAMTLRKSVRELASHWRVSRGLLEQRAETQLQREMDRVILLAVQYVIANRSLGLWQYLVDMPFDCVSDDCLAKVEYLLRIGGDEKSLNVRELFDTPTRDITNQLQQGSLATRLDAAGPQDTVFLVNALACLVAQSSRDPTPFLKEIVQTCFVEPSTRDSLYKVGGEAIGTVLGAKPSSLDPLLTIIDRSIDHMEDHAVDIFASAPLHLCKLGESVVGGVIGKWLMARAPDRAGNRVARRVLSSLNWGYEDDSGQRLWMSERVHAVAADTVLKAHVAHCARTNGMIAKNVAKISKLVSKIPDYEQHFSQFCWDILVKLKLPVQPSTKKPEDDLVAFFVYAAQHSLDSVDAFADSGLNYVGELVNAGSTYAAVVLMGRAFARHYEKMQPVLAHKNFVGVFERVLHSDQCSYAYHLLAGPSSAPTPVVRVFTASIVFYAGLVPDLGAFLRAWVDAICLRRAHTFNADQVSLQLLGTITRLAFERDPNTLLGIPEMLSNAYSQQLLAWREASKGFLSMFSGTPVPPPLIAPTYLSVSSWASYACLLAEDSAFDAFHAAMNEAMAKKDKTTLEDGIKKATSKVSYLLPIERMPVFRWAELVRACGSGEREKDAERDAPVLALSLQRLAHQMFVPRASQLKKHQLARKFYTCAAATAMWRALEESLESRPSGEARGLPKAVVGWLKASVDISMPSFGDYSRFDLDYLLQLVIADDKTVWLDFVDLNVIASQDAEDTKLYASICHERGRPLPRSASNLYPTGMGAGSGAGSRAVPFPQLPSHPSLPPAPVLDRSISSQPQVVTQLVQPLLGNISSLAIQFCASSDMAEDQDKEYCVFLSKLYTPAVRNVGVTITCGTRCNTPLSKTVQVSATEFSKTTDATMTRNREERAANISGLQQAVLDLAAVHTASIEYISRELCAMAVTSPANIRNTGLQQCGRSLFYLLTTSISSADKSPILFPPATSALEHSLRTLGREFIMNRPDEQLPVMKVVLNGFVLAAPLVESFSPECLSSNLLVEAYERLSDAVARPELSQRALLLLSRLSISRAISLPPHQFRPLMPLAFRNVASSGGDNSSALAQLCQSHFIAFLFHQFPLNFAYGLELTLNGCNAGTTPAALLDSVAKSVNDLAGNMSDYHLDGKTSLECISVTSRALNAGRTQGLSSLFTRWQKYVDSLGILMQLFIMKHAAANFNAESPTSLIQNELASCFGHVCSLFGPLIAPSQPSLPPFSPSGDEVAGNLLSRFVATLSTLPHSPVLPPGSQNVLSLVWRYYAEQLTGLTHGTAHYYGLLETYLVRLPWPQFWPSLRALQAMEDVLSSRSNDCAPLVAQIVVRIAWKDVLAHHVPDELRPSYLATLFLVLVRLNAKSNHVIKVRASMTELLKYLAGRTDWPTVTVEDAERLANTVSVILPHDTASNPTEGVAVMQVIWRKMCGFSSSRDRVPPDASLLLKQCAFLKAELSLVIRTGTPPAALQAYNTLISDTSNVAASQENLRAFCPVARELTCVWSKIADVKMGEKLVTGWQEYLSASPNSQLVLTSLHTVIGSLKSDQHSTALRVLESTLEAYFKRATSTWSEAAQWVSFPAETREQCAKYLLSLPTSDSKLVPLSLTLRAYFTHGDHPTATHEKLVYYLTNLKPKYVEGEAALCTLLAFSLQWLSSSSCPANSSINGYRTMLDWLKRVAHDERGGGFFGAIGIGKKNAYSAKMRVVLQILELFITQQRTSGDKSPELKLRKQENTPVLNSRIAALKDLAAQKANQPYAAAFALAQPFFTRVESHHVGHSHLLLQKVAASIFGNPRYLES